MVALQLYIYFEVQVIGFDNIIATNRNLKSN